MSRLYSSSICDQYDLLSVLLLYHSVHFPTETKSRIPTYNGTTNYPLQRIIPWFGLQYFGGCCADNVHKYILIYKHCTHFSTEFKGIPQTFLLTGMLNKTDKVNSRRFRYLKYISGVKNGYLCNGILKDKTTSRCLVKKKNSLMGHKY